MPASIVLNFETPVSMNAVAFKNAVGWNDINIRDIRDFSIDVLVGGAFLAVSGVKANDSPNINGNRIAFGDNYEDVMISFDKKLDVTAFRMTVYSTSQTDNRGILTEVYALDVEDTNTFVSQDLDSVIKSLDEGKT